MLIYKDFVNNSIQVISALNNDEQAVWRLTDSWAWLSCRWSTDSGVDRMSGTYLWAEWLSRSGTGPPFAIKKWDIYGI